MSPGLTTEGSKVNGGGLSFQQGLAILCRDVCLYFIGQTHVMGLLLSTKKAGKLQILDGHIATLNKSGQ